MVRRWIAFFLSVFIWHSIAIGAPANFSYQGQIIKPDGQPLEGSNVTFYIEILSPTPSECVLYEEYHTLNMTGSNGIFAFEVGDGTQSGSDYEDVNSLTDALSNSIGTISPTTCVVGPNYTPSAGDGRQMRVTFDDGSGPNTLATNHQILSVPYADSASSVDGLTSADILRINNGGSFVLTQANLEWIFANGARYAELQALIDGTSTQYLTATPTGDVSMNSQKIINVADPTAANDAANKNYVDTNIAGQPTDAATLSGLAGAENGHVMYWNGTEWTAGAPAGDSTKLPLAGGTMSGAINMGNQDITNGNNITANGAVSANGLSTGTNLAFYNTGNYVGFQAPAGASDLIWTLPGADGTANQALSTNGSGILSWRSYVETASNQGAGGVGPYKQLNAGDLEFKNINAGSNKVTVTDDVGNDEIDIDVDESNFNPALIPNTAAGDIAAGNVQAAINELDTEKVAIAGDAMTGALTMNAQSEVRFADSDSSNYVGFAAPAAVGADLIWTLPNADGTNGQILSTDGAGNLVWISGAVGDITGGSSLGAGVSVYKNENAGVLEFASINAGSNKVTITDDAGVEIDIDVDETNFDPTAIPNNAAGNIAATTLQGAINELDTEKLSDVTGSALADGTVWVGDGSNQAQEVSVTGDVAMSNTGATTIQANAVESSMILDGEIVDADISATAAIARTKMANGAANRLVVNDGSGALSDAAAITGNRALTSDVNGIPVASTVTGTELGYLSGVTSALQIQLDGKVALAGDTMTGQLLIDGGADEVQFAIEGDTLQTANLVEIRNSASTVIASVSADGSVSAATDLTTKSYVDTAISGINTDEIADADNNTKIQVEEGANDDTIRFDTAGSERMVIDASGNIGIGTPTPSDLLTVMGTDLSSGVRIVNRDSTAPAYPGINIFNYKGATGAGSASLSLRGANGTNTTPSAVNSGEQLGLIMSSGYGDTTQVNSASISFDAAGNFTDSSAPSNIRFSTTSSGSTTVSERMRISSSGNVGIGTSLPGTKLDVEGTIQIGDGGETCSVATNAGMIRYNSGNIDYCNGSAWTTLGVSGAGLTNLNGQTGSTQNFAVDAAGTAPAINSVTNTHTLSIPLASGAGVTSGTLSKTDYDAFSAKLDSVVGETLTSAQFWVGDVTNAAAAVTMSGDATMDNAGAVTIANNAITSAKINDGEIVDADISTTADIARSKLAAGTANRLIVNDGTGEISEAAAITASRALTSDANGIPVASSVTSTELGYLSGVTSALQTQLDGKVDLAGDTMTGQLLIDGGADEVQLAIEGDLLQTANLVELRNSSSVVVASVSADGSVSAATDLTTKAYVDSAVSGISTDEIADADNNTKIQVEEGANDDTIRFDTAGTERMVVGPTGNVGIGSATPSALLDVNGSAVFDTDTLVIDSVNNRVGIGEFNPAFTLSVAGVAKVNSGLILGATSNWRLSNTGASNNFVLTDNDTSTDRLFVDGLNGNIGIGTTAPSEKLEVSGNGTNTKVSINHTPSANSDTEKFPGFTVSHYKNAIGGYGTLAFFSPNGTSGSPTSNLSNDNIGGLIFKSYGNTDYGNSASVVGKSDGAATDISTPGRLEFQVTPSGSTTLSTAMTIKESGNVGIGTTNPAVALDVNTGSINAAEICDENNANCLDLSAGVGGGGSVAGASDGQVQFKSGTDFAAGNLHFDSTNDWLGVGRAPLLPLHVEKSNGGSVTYNTSTMALFQNNANTTDGTNIMMRAGSTGLGALYFGDSVMDKAGGIEYDHSTDTMAFRMVNTNVAFFDSSGNLGIGTSTPQAALDVNTGSINAAQICDENNANCLDLSAGVGGGGDFLANGSVPMTGAFEAVSGTAAAPGITFNGEEDTGFYVSGLGTIGVATDGVNAAELNNTAWTIFRKVRTDNGSAAEPEFSFNNNIDTGIFDPAADTLGFSTAGTERMRIDATGNVAIGTATPQSALSIYNTTDGGGNITLESNDWANSIGLTFRQAGFDKWSFGLGNDSTENLYLRNNYGDLIQSWNYTTGHIGIGTTSPGQALDIRGDNGLPATSGSTQTGSLRVSSTGTTMTLDSGVHSGSGAWIQATQRNLLNNTFNLLLNPNGGNVGIGTTGPAVALDVNAGTINAASICDENNANCIDLSGGSGGGAAILDGGNSTGANLTVGTNDNFDLNFETNGTNNMTLTSSGKLGIGTTAPSSRLTVVGSPTDGSMDDIRIVASRDTASSTVAFEAKRQRETGGYLLGGDKIFSLIGQSYNGVDMKTDTTAGGDSASIEFYVAANHALNDIPGEIRFNTADVGESNDSTRMTIASNGYVGIGDTTPGATLEITTPVGDANPAIQANHQGTGHFMELNNAGVSKVRISNEGYLGIGDFVTPTIPLYIGNLGADIQGRIRVQTEHDSNSTGSTFEGYRKRTTGTGAVQDGDDLSRFSARGHDDTGWVHSDRGILTIEASETWTSSANGTQMRFFVTPNGTTSASEVLKIENNGFIGMGTSAASSPLHITTDSFAGDIVRMDNLGDTSRLRLFSSLGSEAAPSAITNGFAFGNFSMSGYGTTGFQANGQVSIKGVAAETFTDTAAGAHLTISTTPIGTNTNAERVRITSAGKVGIGTTSPRTTLDVNGSIASAPADAEAANTIDFANSNFGYTAQSCGATTFNLHNMKDGATYTMAVQGTTSGTCAFSAFSDAGSTPLTVKYPPSHAATTTGTETLYSFVVIGSSVYVAWVPGYAP